MRIHRLFGFVLVFLITLAIPALHGQETPVTLADQATALVRIVITRPGIEVLRHESSMKRWVVVVTTVASVVDRTYAASRGSSKP